MKRTLLLLFIILPTWALGQTVIKGFVFNGSNKNPLPGAHVVIQGGGLGLTTNDNGSFEIKDLQPGLYNVEVSYTGFRKQVIHQLQVSTVNPVVLEIMMEEQVNELDAIEITSGAFPKTIESPMATKNLNQLEMQSIPGAVMDVSKAVQALPGVLPRVPFGYAMVVRGGASNKIHSFWMGCRFRPSITSM